MMAGEIELVGVSYHRGPRQILQNINLRITRGELVALIGPNGAGKSTLLGVIAGDLPPSIGKVRFDGTDIARITCRNLSQQRAVLEQQPGVGFGFTVTEVVQMGRAPWRNTPRRADDEAEVSCAMSATEIASMGDRNAQALSGGETARTGFARVLAQATPWLLLDEPAAALDLRHQRLTMQTVRAKVAAGAGAVVVSHDLDAAAAWATRVVVLKHGQIRADGPTAEVLTQELLTSVYETPVDVFPHPDTGRPVIRPLW